MSWERLQMLVAAQRRHNARQTLILIQGFAATQSDADTWNAKQQSLIEQATE